MNIPQPDLIICTPCGEKMKRPATHRRYVTDPVTHQEHFLDTCDLHDAKLARFLGHVLVNGHRHGVKLKLNGRERIELPGAPKLGRPKKIVTAESLTKAKRPSAGTSTRPHTERRVYKGSPEHRAKDAERKRREYRAAHGEPKKRGEHKPLPAGQYRQANGGVIAIAGPPFKCSCDHEPFAMVRGLMKHANANGCKPTWTVVKAPTRGAAKK